MKRITCTLILFLAIHAKAQKIKQVTKSNFLNPVELLAFNGKVFFTGGDTSRKSQLFVLDGSKSGVKQITNFSRATGLDKLFTLNGKLYFQSPIQRNVLDSPFLADVFVTDGTSEGTQEVHDFPFDLQSLQSSAAYNNKLYYVYRSQYAKPQLWVTDGTKNGTRLIYDQFFRTQRFFQSQIYSGKLYFHATNNYETGGSQLWAMGTDEQPIMVKDFSPNTNNGIVGDFKVYQDILCFVFEDEKGNYKLGISDGTVDGTSSIQNFQEENYSINGSLFNFKDNLYFFSYRDSSSLCLFDGIGIQKVISFPSLQYYGGNGIEWNSKYLLPMHTPQDGYRLWNFDGKNLKKVNLAVDTSSAFAFRGAVAGKKGVYFFSDRKIDYTASQGTDSIRVGFGLCYTDGTTRNTKIIFPQKNDKIQEIRERFFKADDTIYFIAKTTDFGWQIFKIEE